MMVKAQILVVEDDNMVVMELRDRLRSLGYTVAGAASYGEEAIAKAGEMRPDLVLMDIRLRGAMDGIEAAAKIRDLFGIPVVYLTALADEATLQRAKTTEPYGYLMKPFDSTELYAVIETALHKYKLETGLRESEEKYRRVVEQSSDAIVLTDEEGAIIEWNPAAEQITGLRHAEVLGRPVWDIQFQVVPEEQRSRFRYEQGKTMVLDLLRKGEAPWLHQLEEVEIQCPDGTRRTIQTSGFVIPTDQGFRAGSVIRDITERKRAEEALQRREERFRSLIENALDVIMIVNRDGTMRYTSPSIERVLGYEPEEFTGKSVFDFIHPDDLPNTTSTFTHIIQNPFTLIRVEARVRHKDGSWHMLEAVNNNLLDDPAVAGIVANFRDITERKRAEKALQESEARYRQLVKYAPTAIYEVDMTSGKFLSVNDVMCEYLGYSREELLTMDTFSLITDESSKQLATERWAKMLAGEAVPETAEYKVSRKDGGEICVLVNTRVCYEDGKPAVAEAVAYDITERKEAEEALQESEERFRGIVERSFDAIVALDLEGRFTYVSPAAKRVTGYKPEELVRKHFRNYFAESDIPKAVQAFTEVSRSGSIEGIQLKMRRKDGSIIHIEANSSPIFKSGEVVGIQGIYRDITERKRAEEEIRRRTAQLEALRAVSLELTAELDLDALLRSIVSRAMELLKGASGGLYLCRPERDVLEWAVAVGPNLAPIGTVLRRGEGLSGKVWETGEPLIVDDYQQWKGRAAVYEGYPFGATVGVPVRWGEEFLGVLDVLADLPHTFSPADAELLGLFATQAAIAIRNARLYEEARRRGEERRLLFEATRDVSASLELDEVLEYMAAHLCRAAEATSGDILTLDESGERATVRAQYWSPEASLLERISDVGTVYDLTRHPAILQAMRENRPLVTHADDPDLEPATREMMAHFGGRSALRIPIQVTGALRGYALVWDSQRRHEWTDEEVRLCQTLANQAAIAIENARLYEKAQREIAERMRAEKIIKQMAYHDDLTGLPNRRLLNDRLNLEMAHAQRDRQKVAVMLLDLDHFKEVNDTLGHSMGDKLLQAVGNRLTSLLRKGDTVARMGGDEFMLLLPGIIRLGDVAKTARKILEAFRRPVEFDSRELCITTSIGIALYPDDGEDSDTLMKNADIAMYRAKGEGRDNYQCYSSLE